MTLSPGAFTIDGPAGRLECLAKSPSDELRFSAVVCHPHPLHGGTMHTRVVYRIAHALARCGGVAVRFNFRGVGASQGAHDHGQGERHDLDAVVEYTKRSQPSLPLLVAGFSFGAWVALRFGAHDDRVAALLGVGVATTVHPFDELVESSLPKGLIQGGADPFGPEPELRALLDRLKPPKSLAVVEGADHFFTGAVEQLEDAVEQFARSTF